jgi:hypothetical protein
MGASAGGSKGRAGVIGHVDERDDRHPCAMTIRYEAGSALAVADAEVKARVTLLKGDSKKLNYTALHGKILARIPRPISELKCICAERARHACAGCRLVRDGRRGRRPP